MPPSALAKPALSLLVGPDGRRLPLSEVVRRTDAWENEVTGFGTRRDKSTYGSFHANRVLSAEELSDLYHHSDMPRRVVDLLPTEALREPFEVDCGDEALNELVEERLEQIGCRPALLDGWCFGRLYGGCGVILGADDGRPASMPLVPERARSLEYLYVVDRRELFPVAWYQEPGPRMGEPELFMVTTSTQSSSRQDLVHESRIVLFGGERTARRERQINHGWDHSVLQPIHDVIRSYESGWKAVEVMLTDANQSVFKIAGLAALIAAGNKDALEARVQLVDMYRSALRAVIVDAGEEGGTPAEEFERQQVSFEGVPQVLEKLMLRMASAARAPATKLLGMSPGGMNATGESDFRGWYDGVRSEQRHVLTPRIRRIVSVMLAARDFAAKPKTISVEYCPLWSEPPKEVAETALAKANTRKILIESGVLLPEEVAISDYEAEDAEFKIDIATRKKVLSDELAKLKEGKPEPVPPPAFGAPPLPPGPAGTGQGQAPPEDEGYEGPPADDEEP